ncbi:MAG TPA: peptidoglycan-binding protein [Solirubrobacteraceae bacterium]|nr:peptidoglycan-binding protein [Solirubrobacteraceae bacterium]
MDHWNASLERSLARRERARNGRARNGRASRAGGHSSPSAQLTTLLDARGARRVRDLAELEPWQLSLGRSRARRRASQLRFVPASSRAKRASLGALVALSVGPSVAVLSGGSVAASAAAGPEPPTTTEHTITLSYGSEGRQVKLLQQALGGVKVDGIFGPETEAAVRRFQASKGLAVDGIVGPLTNAALRGEVARKAIMSDFKAPVPGESEREEEASGGSSATATSAQGASAGATGAGATSAAAGASETAADATGGSAAGTLQAGSGGTSAEALHVEAVEQLQAALHLPVDGDFGPETEAAVRRLQARNGLAADGVVGPQTWAAIGVHGRETLTPPAAAKAVAEGAPQTNSTTRAVEQLQAALHLPVDGEFGPETEAAVRRLQARNGLTVDGVVGPQTWGAIGVSGEPTLAPAPSALSKPPAPRQEPAAVSSDAGLTPGSGGTSGAPVPAPPSTTSAIEWLQAALHLPVDGEFGPETEAAVRRLQARHGLAVDGVVGPQTWAVIGVQDAPTLTPPPSALVSAPAAQGAGEATPGAGEATPGATGGAGAGGVEAESIVARVIEAADEIATRPYVYGGGHGSFESYGYDCSGSVSYALHGGGLLSSPEDSTELESYGEPGPGRFITIYANAEHAYMVIEGKRFDTVALAEDGSRWSDSPGDDGGEFVERHPDGL